MNKVAILTKIFLKTSFQSFRSSKKSQKVESEKKKKRKFGMAIAYIFLFFYLAGVFGYLSYNMISGLIQIHQEQVFIGLFFLAIAMLLLFQSVFSSMNLLYWSKDIEYILPLPIKPSEILMAKLNTLLITEYITEILFGLVPLVLYGILTGAGVFYYIMMILCLMVFPILPIVIVTFLVTCVMSIAKIAKNREKFQMIATICIIIVAFGIQYVSMNASNQDMTNEMIAQQMVKMNGLVDNIGNYFITLKPTIHAMTETNIGIALIEFLKLVAITIGAYAIFILIGQKLYLRGAIGNNIGGSTKKKNFDGKKEIKTQKIGVSYVKKEFKTLVRNPIFLMQCILPALLMPILFMFIFFTTMSKMQPSDTAEFQQALQGGMNPLYIIGGTLAVIQFFSMMIYISVTAISRDGLNATFMKYIPLSLYKQFQYKAIPNIIMSMVTIIMVVGAIGYYMKVSIVWLVIIFILATLLSIVQSYLMEIVDLKKPKLNWDSEYSVVKQNMNLIWPMFYGMAMIGILILFMGVGSTINPIAAIILLTVVIIGMLYGIDRYVYRNQVQLFEKII